LLAKRAFPGISQNVSDTYIADQFIDGIRIPEIQIKLKVARPTLNSLNEIVELASRYEEVLDPEFNMRSSIRNVTFQPMAQTDATRCYNCNQIGHKRFDCPQKNTSYAAPNSQINFMHSNNKF
jgi:hypothetical protein